MRAIKFSILLQHDETGRIVEHVFSFADIFNGTAKAEIGKLKRYAVIARREYTGLKNKHGKEIYEGDIILVANTQWTVAWHRHENGMTGWMVKDNEIHHWYVIDTSILRGEIIGNIYGHPDLMKGGPMHDPHTLTGERE